MIDGITGAIVNEGNVVAKRFAWNESVKCVQLRDEKLKAVPAFGVVSEESRQFLGIYAKKVHVVQNARFAELIESGFNNLGITFNRKIILSTGKHENSRCELRYTLPSLTFKGPDGRDMAQELIGRNSYDATWNLSAAMSALRLACLNGAYGITQVSIVNERHAGEVNKRMEAPLQEAIENAPKMIGDALEKLAQFSFANDQQPLYILRNMYMHNPLRFSGLMARKFSEAFLSPTEDEKDIQGNLYGLFQAGTRTLRDMEATKPELVDRTGDYFGKVLTSLATEETFRAKLLKPITADEAFKRERTAKDIDHNVVLVGN